MEGESMTPAEAVKARTKRIITNKGHVRLFFLFSIVWMAVTTWLLWQALPPAPQSPDPLGFQRVTACMDIVVDYDQCASAENFKVEAAAVAVRAFVIFFLPLILPFLVILGAFVYEWVKEGYRKNQSAQ